MLARKQGTYYETLFVAEAMKQGLDVFLPVGDYSIVDALVQNPAGKHFRVQVKGTNVAHRKTETNNGHYRIVLGKGAEHREIPATEIDMLVAYIEPVNCWYLIPMVKAAGRKSYRFYPEVPTSTSQWTKYKDNWDVFF
jgi:hypothetical protein